MNAKEKFQYARQLAQRGDYAQARQMVAHINHPRVLEFLAQMDAHEARARRRSKRKLWMALVTLGVLTLLGVLVASGMSQSATAGEAEAQARMRSVCNERYTPNTPEWQACLDRLGG